MYMSTKIYSIKTKYDNDEEIKINAYNLGEVKESADSGNTDGGSDGDKTIDDLIDSASLQEPYKFYSTNVSNEETTPVVTESGEGVYYNNTTTSKSKSYFWVEDLKNWCRYAISNNYVDYNNYKDLKNPKKLYYGISFKLQVWNGSYGWLDIDENGVVNFKNDVNKIISFQKDIIERLILPDKNDNNSRDPNWDIKSINKITQARGNVNYFNYNDLIPASVVEDGSADIDLPNYATFRILEINGNISSDLEKLFNRYNLFVDGYHYLKGTTKNMKTAFADIDVTNNVKINLYLSTNQSVSAAHESALRNLFSQRNIEFGLAPEFSGMHYLITGKYTDVFDVLASTEYETIIESYNPKYYADARFTTKLDTYYVIALDMPQNKQIIKGFKLQKTINYCINTNVDFQTYRYILSQEKSDFATMGHYLNSDHRTVSYTGIPPIWRLPTGEVFLSTNFECNTDVGMPYDRRQLDFYKKDYKVREALNLPILASTKPASAKDSVEVTSLVSSIYADDITRFETEINNKIAEYFGSGKDKTIKKDWLREYSITKVINTETDYVNMLDSNLIFEQVNSNDNADLKCTLKVNRPNIITDEYEPVEYVKKW